jgi:predicted nucleotidyltransferase
MTGPSSKATAWQSTQNEERVDVDPLLAEVVRRLVDVYRPERVYLFGSRARGDARADSDYDLLVLLAQSDEPSFRRARRGYHALHGSGIAVDLLVWTMSEFERRLPAKASLPATVSREGRLLYAA